jgi:hypothetical protein
VSLARVPASVEAENAAELPGRKCSLDVRCSSRAPQAGKQAARLTGTLCRTRLCGASLKSSW